MKRNNVPPPIFSALAGEVVIAYASHDGRAVIGEGEASFETMWSSADSSSIHVVNDPPGIRGIAIALGARSPADVTAAIVSGLDFTSRVHTPREGQVVVFENESGRFLAAQVIDVLATSHGDAEDRLALRYSVLPADRDERAVEVARLVAEVEAELRRLRPRVTLPASAHGGMGHNNPPELLPMSIEEHDEVIEAAQRIGQEAVSREPDGPAVVEAASKLASAASAIVEWVGRKCDLAAEEFAKQIGKSLADARVLLGGWLILSGKIDALFAAVSTWLP